MKFICDFFKGLLKAIGVSNFGKEDIENIMEYAKIKPMVNQIRVHVGHVPYDLIQYCQEKNILVEAFSPNATGKLFNHPLTQQLAKKYNVSVSQLCIRFDLQLGLLPLSKITHKEYMINNAGVDFEISEEDMKKILAVEEVNSL